MGYNLKPLDLQGAIGIAQLDKVDYIFEKRREYKKIIQGFIEENIPEVRVIDATKNSDPSWFGVPILCECQEIKERLVSYFEENKIQTRNYFAGNILVHPGYEHLDDYRKYKKSNEVLSKVFFIGCSPLYNEKVLNYIEEICIGWKR